MEKIENLDIGHIKHGFDRKFIVRISEVFDDRSLETDFPHRHNFYMICLIVKGSGTHVIDFEKVDIIPNRLFFLRPEQVHFWQVQPESKLAVIQFSDDFLTELFNYNQIPAITNSFDSFIDLSPDVAASFYQKFQIIATESSRNQINSKKIIQATIFILLSEIERLINTGTETPVRGNKYMLLDSFRVLLNKRYKEITSISEYADLLNITPNYLNIVVKETTGLTATDLMHKRIILEAKRLLINEHYDITQVAFEMGFKDASYFARFFKKSTGQSPSEFRNDIYKMYQH